MRPLVKIKNRRRNRSTEDKLHPLLAGAAAKLGKKLSLDDEKLASLKLLKPEDWSEWLEHQLDTFQLKPNYPLPDCVYVGLEEGEKKRRRTEEDVLNTSASKRRHAEDDMDLDNFDLRATPYHGATEMAKPKAGEIDVDLEEMEDMAVKEGSFTCGSQEVQVWAEHTKQSTIEQTNEAMKNLLKGVQPLHCFRIRKLEVGFFEWIFHFHTIREAYRFRRWVFNRPLGLNETSRLKTDLPPQPDMMRVKIFVPINTLETDKEIVDSLSIMNAFMGSAEIDPTFTAMERAWENLNLSARTRPSGAPRPRQDERPWDRGRLQDPQGQRQQALQARPPLLHPHLHHIRLHQDEPAEGQALRGDMLGGRRVPGNHQEEADEAPEQAEQAEHRGVGEGKRGGKRESH